MPSHVQAMTRAIKHVQAGEIAQAEAICQQIVRSDPRYADGWNLLGVLAYQTGKLEAALDFFSRAVKAAPGIPAHRVNRAAILQGMGRLKDAEADFREMARLAPTQADPQVGLANNLCQQGRFAEAIPIFEQALKLKADHVDALTNYGTALRNIGRLADAEKLFRRALQLKPDAPEALNNLAMLLADQRNFAEAQTLMQRLLTLAPNSPEALNNFGKLLLDLSRVEESAMACRRALELRPDYPEAFSNLGNALMLLGQNSEAEASYRRAVQLRPNYAEALFNLANALRELHRYEESAACYGEALALRPAFPEAHTNLGNTLWHLGRYDEAEACCRAALAIRPDYAEAHYNLGIILRDLGRFAEAEACYDRALQIRPNYAEAHNNRSVLRLTRGDYEHGWAEYEWRWKTKEYSLPVCSQPLWDGSSLAGRTILLHAEQGLGDTLQFVRYAALVKEQGACVFMHSPRQLLGLLATCPGIDRLLPMDEAPPPFDVYSPLMNLPRWLGTSLANIPAPIPYLRADPQLVDRWRERLASFSGYKVGIVWQGNPKFSRDFQRSAPLARFEPLAKVPDVQLLSLQVGNGLDQLAAVGFAVADLGSSFDAATFDDVAAVLMNINLLVTVDTALAHLAGALGRPFWVVLPHAPDWRWLLDRDDNPWYPTARLFRQRQAGDWEDVFARVAKELEARALIDQV